MILLKILMLLTGLFGFFYALRIKTLYARILNWSMVAAIGMTYTNFGPLIVDGYYLFALTQLGTGIYAISNPEFSPVKKLTLISAGILTLIPTALFLAQQYSFPAIGLISAVVQLAIFAYGIRSERHAFKEELGFLVILSMDSLLRIIAATWVFLTVGGAPN